MDGSDEELIARAIQGDSSAMSKLLMRQYDSLNRLVKRNLPMWMDRVVSPEDVIQEAFARAFANVRSFEPRGDGSFNRWLTKIAKNYILNLIDFHRADRRNAMRNANGLSVDGTSRDGDATVVGLLYMLSRGQKSPRQLAADRESIKRVHAAISTLLPAEYQAVQLRYIEGLDVASTARAMNRTDRAIHQLTFRGLKKLREKLRDSSVTS